MIPPDMLIVSVAAMVIIIGFAIYVSELFYSDPIVKPSCRVQITAATAATIALGILYLPMLIIFPRGFFAVTMTEIAIVAAIVVILILFFTQKALPHYKAKIRSKARLDYGADLFTTLMGKPPTGSSGDPTAELISFWDLAALGGLDKEKLTELADLAARLKADEEAAYDPTELWVHLGSVSGGQRAALTAINYLLDAIETALKGGDLTDEEREKLEQLKRDIQELRDKAPTQ
ncbi:hypothetical protein AB0T83_02365 [Fluviibacterium sp. DFM31]|uniref:Co-chaperone DjlA N-terminal domain-containing protein n=1 Tax=Meridianimarinicoccus marinus TaxID=3231483 RepID=A0ABV3L245_9RHOB